MNETISWRTHRQVFKDYIKRAFIDIVRRQSLRLATPTESLILTLRAMGYFHEPVIALDLFGMHGLWITKDYSRFCSYLELYEIDPVYARYAKLFLKNASVVNGDSIQAVKKGHLKRPSYNLIVSDNPSGSPYGHNYHEHFDLFPDIVKYLDDRGILILNYLSNIDLLSMSQSHLVAREHFYGSVHLSISDAIKVYISKIEKENYRVIDFLPLARDQHLSFLSFIVAKV